MSKKEIGLWGLVFEMSRQLTRQKSHQQLEDLLMEQRGQVTKKARVRAKHGSSSIRLIPDFGVNEEINHAFGQFDVKVHRTFYRVDV